MNPVNLLHAQPGHTQRTDFARQDEDAHENRPRRDDEDGDCRGLDELVTWLRSLAARNIVDIRDAKDKESQNETKSRGETTQPVDGKPQKKRPRRNKTPFQQEYNKISQRERRQEKRRQKRREKRMAEEGVEVDDEDTIDFALLWVIYLAHERNGQLRKEFPKSAQEYMDGTRGKQIMEEYMRHYDDSQGLDCSSPKELEEYLGIKRRELIGLRRRLAVMNRTEKYYDDRLRAVDLKLKGLKKESPEWYKTKGQERFHVVHRLMVVRHAAVVLPILLDRAKNRLQELTSTVNEGYEMKVLFDEAESLRGQLSDEKKKLDLLGKQIKHVVPMSEIYNEMLVTLCKVEERNDDLEKQIKKVEGDLEAKVIAKEGYVYAWPRG